MKYFPKGLTPSNVPKFSELANKRLKCYLRRELYEHVISKKPEEYFSLDEFANKKGVTCETVLSICKELIPELEKLGWTCKLSFGDTGLFVYSGKKPSNCYESSF